MRNFVRFSFIGSALALFTACQGSQPSPVVPGSAVRDAARASWSYNVLHRFDLANGKGTGDAFGGLLDVDGTLYGTTQLGGKQRHHGAGCAFRTCGAVYTVTASGAYDVIYAFRGGPRDGANPNTGLIDVNGTLYGTTAYGGTGSGCAGGCGTVYSISPTGAEKVLYSFVGGSDAAHPNHHLLYMNGTFYGTTDAGGSGCGTSSYSCGTVYSVTTGGQEKVLYAFKGGANDGAGPSSPLINVKGTMYGTTGSGGGTGCARGCGTVYSITSGGQEQVVHSFTHAAKGSSPAGLVYVKGLLYGTAGSGGSTGNGIVYSMTTTGNENVLYSFQGGSDAYCVGGPLIYVKGKLYGTSVCGGGCPGEPCGTVFSVTTKGAEQVLYAFTDGPNGFGPDAPLIEVNGTLYGTTLEGGGPKGGPGVIFSLSH
jgi:uncharacterized repeat protein (TIGR03803 family)